MRVDGKRAVMMAIMKPARPPRWISSAACRRSSSPSRATAAQLKIDFLSDQSIFVRSAISGVVREAIVAACLTAIMIPDLPGQLALHGHHRSPPFRSPFSARSPVLYALGETINIMTLGGFALAVGILVD